MIREETMQIGQQSYNRRELLRRVGNIAQLAEIRPYQLTDGSSRGVAAVDVDTGGGFRFTVLPDRGLDISRASWRGINLVYQTPSGEAHPAFYDPRGLG